MKHILLLGALLASLALSPLGADAQGVIGRERKEKTKTKPAAKHNKTKQVAAQRRQQELEDAQREQEEAQRRQQEQEAVQQKQQELEAAQREQEDAQRRRQEQEEAQLRQQEFSKLAKNMVYVQGGTFTMGASNDEEAYDDEKPAHKVTLSSFYICKYEVTQTLWEAVMGSNPSKFKGDNLPVEYVSWKDCQQFINKLNAMTGQHYRLPTEAEWEFAARGGNSSRGYKYSGSNTLSDVAWYDGNSGGTTHPVGSKSPNELGIYDMNGNVWEWCSDWVGRFSRSSQTNTAGPSRGTSRVNRGGSWDDDVRYCRAACRGGSSPVRRFNYLGLRLVRS